MYAIEVTGLTKSYGALHAVQGIDLSIATGEIFALLGPNGAGKTTTVEILEGFRARDSGDVKVLGFDPSNNGQPAREWRDGIGIVLQSTSDSGDLTVIETIEHFSGYYSNPRNVDEVINSLGLEEKASSLIRKLSGGQRRRLDVALGMRRGGLEIRQFARQRDFGTLKRLRGTPMPASSYFIGKAILVSASMVIQILMLLAFGLIFFGLEMPTDISKWLTFTWLVLFGSACSTALGIAFSILPKSGQSASTVVSPIVIILQFFSGVFLIFTQLPPWMQQIAAIFPLKWLTQGVRSVFLPDSFAGQEVAKSWENGRTFLILLVWLVIGIFFSLRKFKWERD